MEISIGAAVYGREGREVGEVSHVVLDGRTRELTYLVVRKGMLLPREIVVAHDAIEAVTKDSVQLRLNERQLEEQPDFIETDYVAAEDDESLPDVKRGSVLYNPVVPPAGLEWYLYQRHMRPPLAVETGRNIPEGSASLAGGMDVWAGDDKVGTLAGVRIHPRTKHVTHIIISRVWISADEWLLPSAAIRAVDEQGIHLSLAREELVTTRHAGKMPG